MVDFYNRRIAVKCNAVIPKSLVLGSSGDFIRCQGSYIFERGIEDVVAQSHVLTFGYSTQVCEKLI